MADINLIPFKTKLHDTKNRKHGAAVDLYWRDKLIQNVFKGRRKVEPPKDFEFYDQNYVLEYFDLESFEYGNWLSQEDRYVYLAGFAFAMLDLSRITKLHPSKLGFKGRLNIAFGSRGVAQSLAHFDPSNFLINITRHRENESYHTSGSGSLGHEWGHALDFYAGNNLANGFHRYASDSLYGSKRPTDIRKYYYDYMVALCGKREKGKFVEPTVYIQNLLKSLSGKSSDTKRYYLSNVEIFARSMEVYLWYKCKKLDIVENFLKKPSYNDNRYPTLEEMKKLAPLMDKLIAETMKKVK